MNGTSTASYSLPTYINFYLMTDVSGSMSMPSSAAEQARLMAVNPDNMQGSPGYPQGCQFACHFSAQGACGQTSASNPYQGPIPAAGSSDEPGIGRILSGIHHFPTGHKSCFILVRQQHKQWQQRKLEQYAGNLLPHGRNDVVYPATRRCCRLCRNDFAATAAASEQVTNQYQVGLFPFIQYLYGCTSITPCSGSSAYFPLTTNLTATGSGSINNAATNLASLLDTGANSNLGSGGTHFENAFASMNSVITSVGTGTSSSNALPYVFIITDGSQNYQTQWSGNWGAANGSGSWSATTNIPYQNSATVIPKQSPNDESGSTDYCSSMKSRGITIAILYIPYQTISDPSTIFDDEDGYANTNIQYIPTALQNCASSNFFYTASTPADINSALVSMFEQAISTAHITN